jgi:methyl-accepting chemotaxis protein
MKSIRIRMMLLFGVSTALFLGILVAIVVFQVNRSFVSFAKSTSSMIVNARAEEIGKLMSGYTHEIRTMTHIAAISSGNIDIAKKYFAGKDFESNSDFDYMLYILPSGETSNSKLTMTNTSDRDYFKGIFQEGKDSYTSKPLISKSTGKRVVILAQAIKDKGGKPVAILGAGVTLDMFSKSAAEIKIGQSGYGWVADGTGLIIAHPNQDVVMKLNVLESNKTGYKGLEEAGKLMVEGKSGTYLITKPDGTPAIIIFSPIPNTPNWVLGVTVPEKELLSPGYSLLKTIGIVIIVILCALFLVIHFITSYITHPLTIAAEHLNKIGDGDFTNKVSDVFLKKQDEIGIIAHAIDRMQLAITNVVKSIKKSSHELASSAQQMNLTSSSFSVNAQNSASTIEELTAAIEEISAGMDSVANNAVDQTEKTKSLISKMDNLSHAVEEMSARISETLAQGEDISEKSREGAAALEMMNKSMTSITDSSSDMINIVKIINDISDQINLLSLNAAIEAARAGDAGRGFAVVADEISKLADQTAQSIKDIDRLIRQNSEEIDKGKSAIDATTITFKSVTNGIAAIAEKIHIISSHMEQQTSIYSEVQNEAGQVKMRTEEITHAMDEQKVAVREVMQSIASINDGTQQNAAGAEELAGSMEGLSQLADRLTNEIGTFKVK